MISRLFISILATASVFLTLSAKDLYASQFTYVDVSDCCDNRWCNDIEVTIADKNGHLYSARLEKVDLENNLAYVVAKDLNGAELLLKISLSSTALKKIARLLEKRPPVNFHASGSDIYDIMDSCLDLLRSFIKVSEPKERKRRFSI